MKSLRVAPILVLLLPLFLSCGNPQEPADAGGLALYLLDDPSLGIGDVAQAGLDELTLDTAPILTQSDITGYSWSKPELWITDAAAARLGEVGERPFVLTVGRERIYLGTFWNAWRSSLPPVPYILVGPTLHHPLTIWTSPVVAHDAKKDERIRRALDAAGLLRE